MIVLLLRIYFYAIIFRVIYEITYYMIRFYTFVSSDYQKIWFNIIKKCSKNIMYSDRKLYAIYAVFFLLKNAHHLQYIYV